jgi:hypothetical protein
MQRVLNNASPEFRPSGSSRDLAGELLTDASSWMILLCYLDAAAWIGVAPSWPPADRIPGTDFGRLAKRAVEAQRWGLPGRRDVRVAAILTLAASWLTAARHPDSSAVASDDATLLHSAQIYIRAVCPVGERDTAVELLRPDPLRSERARQRRRHPIRALRTPAWPPVVDPAHWQDSLWWQRAARIDDTIAVVHAAAGMAAAIWSWPGAVGDPIGVRHELRTRVVRARAWATGGDRNP